MTAEWVQVVCRHEGQGLDVAPEVVHRQYVGDDPKKILAGWQEYGPTARMVHDGALVDTPGPYRRNRHEAGTYAHRQIRCTTCGVTERVPDVARLIRALAVAGDAGVSLIPLSGIKGILDGID